MDAYDLQARHAPVVFATLPVVLVAIALVPGLGQIKLTTGGVAFVIVAALAFIATRIARSAGRARQAALFTSWGGIPTTAMLRYRDGRLNPQTKKIYRNRLAQLGAEFPIPDETTELHDPEMADIQIGAAIDEIRKRAKERQIKTVYRENINYGAARNAYGLRPFGLVACAIAVGVLIASVALRPGRGLVPIDLAVAMAILVIAGIWIFGCTKAAVKHHAEAYAVALFEAIDGLTKRRGRKNKA